MGVLEHDAATLIQRTLRDSAAVKQQIVDSPAIIETIVRAADAMARAIFDGKKLLFFGNGGSAADAQHLTAEFTGRFMAQGRKPLAAVALTANTSSLTAIGNDFTFDEVFSREVQALGNPGDVAIGISTSGNSPNVLKALEAAKANRLTTIGLTGRDGGRMKALVDIAVIVPSKDTQRIQESHIAIGHAWCELVEHAYLARAR